MIRNNLFRWATKELSQDAFVCWLMSYSLKEAEHEPVLNACSQAFLREFLCDCAPDIGVNLVVEDIEQQYDNIDVLLTVNGKYKVIIEDKTYSREHGNQLMRYIDIVRKKFPNFTVVGVFYKTGFQSDYSQVREAGYHIVERNTIVSILEKFTAQTTNRILKDYFEYFKDFEQEAQSFKTTPVSEWESRQINAFFDYLKKSDFNGEYGLFANYGKVNNPAGGFYGMWFSNGIWYHIDGIKCELYFQMEYHTANHKLNYCLKVSAPDESGNEKGSALRDSIIYRKDSEGKWLQDELGKWSNRVEDHGYRKPARYGSGKTMSLGVLKKNREEESYSDIITNLEEALENYCGFVKEFSGK